MKKMIVGIIAPLAAKFFFERPANRRSFAELQEKLENSAKEIKSRIDAFDAVAGSEKMGDSEKAIAKLRHIIAIERWGQNRMALFFVDEYSEGVVQDENYDYAPAEGLTWSELGESFGEARAKTIEIARRLELGTETKHDKIPQNDFGPISAKAWLQYLNVHASFEAKGIK